MLKSKPIIAFVPTKDFKKALSFYKNKLGLQFVGRDSFALVFRANKTPIRIFKVDDFEPAPFTILGWEVKNIKRVVTHLKKRGVSFEKYKGMDQDPNGIWKSPSGSKVAWFKDPDGNTLSITEL